VKKPDWLTLFGWLALLAIVLLSLLVWPLRLSDKTPAPAYPFSAPADIKYAARNGKNPALVEETAETRALYASDLFASSRDNFLPPPQTATNQSYPRDIIPSGNPLFLTLPLAANETGGEWFAMTGRKIDNNESALELRFSSSKPIKKSAGRPSKISVELKGELKHFSLDPDIFSGITLPVGQKAWSVQAQMQINSAGRVEHVFAEPTDCDPSVYREIVKRLYQCAFSNVTQSCEGAVIISCP